MKILFFVTFCSLIWISKSFASDFEKARGYFDLKQYSKTEEIYLQALKKPLESWQQDFIHFNLGSSYAAESKWDLALEQFSLISSSQNISPLLRPKLLLNLAIVLIAEQEMVLKDHLQGFPAGFSNEMMQLAKKMVDAAEESDCQLQKLEGYQQCNHKLEIEAVKNRISNFFESAHQKPQNDQNFYEEMNQLLEQTQIDSQAKKSPKSILLDAIRIQKIAFDLMMLSLDSLTTGEIKQSVKLLIEKAQKKTLELSREFSKAVLELQNKTYREKSSVEACQEKPWDRVISLYDEGYMEASTALKLWQVRQEIGQVMSKQKKAIAYWQEAIKAMEKGSKEATNQLSKADQTQENVIQKLVEMYSSDLKPRTEQQPTLQTDEKPW